MTTLRERISLVEASRDVLNRLAIHHHFMHRAVHPRSSPFGWTVTFDGRRAMADGKPCGFVIFASIHFTRMAGEFGYPGLPTQWQVLSMARLWLHDDLPHNSETCVLAKAHKLVQRRWLEIHPPRFLDQPYHVRKIVSYVNTSYHQGTIYRAANYREVKRTVSQVRHRNTRGPGMGGDELICYVYDLPEPHWKYEPIQLSLEEQP